jgi:hypothetical protein
MGASILNRLFACSRMKIPVLETQTPPALAEIPCEEENSLREDNLAALNLRYVAAPREDSPVTTEESREERERKFESLVPISNLFKQSSHIDRIEENSSVLSDLTDDASYSSVGTEEFLSESDIWPDETFGEEDDVNYF